MRVVRRYFYRMIEVRHFQPLMMVVACSCGEAAPVGGDALAMQDGATPDAARGPCGTDVPWAAHPAVDLGPIQETAAVAFDGKMYVIGGFNGVLGVVAKVQIFDPASCAWSQGPELPRTVHHANAAVVGDTIYVLGAMEGLGFTAIANVWAWSPNRETTWSARSSMPAGTERGSAVVGVIADQIYLAGGLRGGAVAEHSRYTPSTDTWEVLEPLPAPRDHGCGGAIGNTLIVAGGRQGAINSTSSSVFAFQPGVGWSARAEMPTARGGTACGVIADALIVVGGEGNGNVPSGVLPHVERYVAASDSWQTLAPMRTPRHGMAAAAIAGRLYVPGGATSDGFGAVAVHEVLTP